MRPLAPPSNSAARVSAIWTSDLERAHETAAIIGHVLRLPLRYERALRERNFGTARVAL